MYDNDMDCLFCKFAKGEIKTKVIYEDENVLAFDDIKPQAPVHVLIIPKKHIDSMNTVGDLGNDVLVSMMRSAQEIAKAKNVSEKGYRIVINTNREAGQEIFHIHMHLLGGRKFSWPPG